MEYGWDSSGREANVPLSAQGWMWYERPVGPHLKETLPESFQAM